MKHRYSKIQKDIISKLIDKYEASKSYEGSNIVSQTFFVKPEQFFNDYNSDYVDLDLTKEFEEQVDILVEDGLVHVEKRNNVITKIYAVDDLMKLYEAINRKDKRLLIEEQIVELKKIEATTSVSKKFISEQIEIVSSGKKMSYGLVDTVNIVALVDYICANTCDILERELSIVVLSDSKMFEQKYKSKVCCVLEKYGDIEVDNLDTSSRTVREHEILEEYGILANPAYVYLKGNGRIIFDGEYTIDLVCDIPIALNNESIRRITTIEIYDNTIMTVENLTSFNRMKRESEFYIYLSGYHNRTRREFLKQAYESNSSKSWCHFGDIDPDGLLILDHLINMTNIPFKSFKMGIDELVEYSAYAKILEKNDRVKAQKMIENDNHCRIAKYMLDNNIKLEQEVISWKLNS